MNVETGIVSWCDHGQRNDQSQPNHWEHPLRPKQITAIWLSELGSSHRLHFLLARAKGHACQSLELTPWGHRNNVLLASHNPLLSTPIWTKGEKHSIQLENQKMLSYCNSHRLSVWTLPCRYHFLEESVAKSDMFKKLMLRHLRKQNTAPLMFVEQGLRL